MCTYLGNILLYWSRHRCLLDLRSVDNQAQQNYLIGKSLAGQEKKKIHQRVAFDFLSLIICQGLRPDFYIQLTLLNFFFAVRPKPFHTVLSGGVMNGVEQVHYLVCGTLYFPFGPILVKNQPQIFRGAESQDYR